jgi:hypothetical protein
MLLAAGAEINCRDSDEDTPLICACRKEIGTETKVLVQRRKVAVELIKKGASFTDVNIDGLNAVQAACRSCHEKMAIVLIQRGARLQDVEDYMARMKNPKDDVMGDYMWVAGSVMSKFGFSDATYTAKLKAEWMEKFDKNGDGELDKDELLTFLAWLVKFQFKSGLVPTTTFDGGSLDIDQIEKLLLERDPQLVRSYVSAFDKDGDCSFTWNELLPVVQDFYGAQWKAKRPVVVDEGSDELVSPVPKEAAGAALPVLTRQKPLPLNWYEVVNPGEGPAVYYAHATTNEVSWERPVFKLGL